jgi:hypothetical protein
MLVDICIWLQSKKETTAHSSTFYFARAPKIKRACLFSTQVQNKNKDFAGISKNVRKFVRVRNNVRE